MIHQPERLAADADFDPAFSSPPRFGTSPVPDKVTFPRSVKDGKLVSPPPLDVPAVVSLGTLVFHPTAPLPLPIPPPSS